jgi:hypothetical protein
MQSRSQKDWQELIRVEYLRYRDAPPADPSREKALQQVQQLLRAAMDDPALSDLEKGQLVVDLVGELQPDALGSDLWKKLQGR